MDTSIGIHQRIEAAEDARELVGIAADPRRYLSDGAPGAEQRRLAREAVSACVERLKTFPLVELVDALKAGSLARTCGPIARALLAKPELDAHLAAALEGSDAEASMAVGALYIIAVEHDLAVGLRLPGRKPREKPKVLALVNHARLGQVAKRDAIRQGWVDFLRTTFPHRHG